MNNLMKPQRRRLLRFFDVIKLISICKAIFVELAAESILFLHIKKKNLNIDVDIANAK